MSNPSLKPWGNYLVLTKNPGYQVKRVTINPDSRTSLQQHKRRSEFWAVVQGEGTFELGYENSPIIMDETKSGIYHYIPCGAIHRIANTGSSDLIFIEVQTGDYLEEDDIIRYDDDYGREIQKNNLKYLKF